MLLSMGLFLAGAFTFVEITLVRSWPGLHRIYTQGFNIFGRHIPGMWMNIIGSLMLSFIVGAIFPAAGLIVMFAGITSTFFSSAYFKIEPFLTKGANACKQGLENYRIFMDRNRELIHGAANTIRHGFHVIAAVFLAIMWVIGLPSRLIETVHNLRVPRREYQP